MPAEPSDSPRWAYEDQPDTLVCPKCLEEFIEANWDGENGLWVCECGGTADPKKIEDLRPDDDGSGDEWENE